MQLTPLEFRIVSMLAAKPGQVVPHVRLIEYAYGRYTKAHAETCCVPDITHIRKKLRQRAGPDGLDVVRGVGYRLTVAPH